MTDLNDLPDEIRTDVEEARASKQKIEREMQQAISKREKEYAPRWARINLRRVANSLGEEYTISLTPKGAHPKGGHA